MAEKDQGIEWLMAGDPAIRWQVLRDLCGAPVDQVRVERLRVGQKGWGAALLDLQGEGGQWGAPDDDGWMTSVWALATLRELGADPASPRVRDAIGKFVSLVRWWQLGDEPFFEGETEACINGRILGAGAWFGTDTDRLAARLAGEVLRDGGWNCDAPPSVRSSFHSTICVLEGLLAYEQARGAGGAVGAARARGEAYLLERGLRRRASTGKVIDPEWDRFGFPVAWHFDVLRGLDYLRAAGVAADERVAEAVEVVRDKRGADGRWVLEAAHGKDGMPGFEAVGEPSRAVTLKAMRVLEWADG